MIVLVLSPFQIQSHLALLETLPEGNQAHNHVRRALNDVVGLGGGPAANGQANNGHETETTATASPNTSATPVSTRTRGQRAIASPSPSTSAAPVSTRTRGQRVIASPSPSAARGRGRPAIASPSTSAARGHGRPATASPSTSTARGCGRRATTPRVVTSPEMPAPIPHSSPQLKAPPPIPDAFPQPEVPSPSPPS